MTLPAGEVEIHYAVRLATNGSGGASRVPGLRFSVEAPEGARDPVVTQDGGGTVTVNTASHVRVWKMQVADAGDYSVTTDGDVNGFIDPQLTFGWGPGPAWPAGVFALLFVVALGLVLVAAARGSQPGSRRRPRPNRRLAPPVPLRVAVPARRRAPNTPEQELARLAKLQQLTDLHRSGPCPTRSTKPRGARLTVDGSAVWAATAQSGSHDRPRAAT